MGARPDYPLIQGYYPSWADADFRMVGINITDIESIKWDQQIEVQDVYGAGALKKGETRGILKPGVVAMELYQDAADKFCEKLAGLSRDGVSVALPQFTGGIQWTKQNEQLSRRVFNGLRVHKMGEDWKQGTDAAVTNFDLGVMRIVNVSGGKRYGLLLTNG